MSSSVAVSETFVAGNVSTPPRPASSGAIGSSSPNTRPTSRGGGGGGVVVQPPDYVVRPRRTSSPAQLSQVTVHVYAATHGVSELSAATAAASSRLEDGNATSISGVGAADLMQRQEAAAALLRKRLIDATPKHPLSGTGYFEPPPLFPPQSPAQRSGGINGSSSPSRHVELVNRSGGSADHHLHASSLSYTADDDAARREHLIEKRAHVELLRRQVEARHSTAETRATHVARTIDAARRKHYERVKALVETGNDHPLAEPVRGRDAAGAPYGEDLVEVFHLNDSAAVSRRRRAASDGAANRHVLLTTESMAGSPQMMATQDGDDDSRHGDSVHGWRGAAEDDEGYARHHGTDSDEKEEEDDAAAIAALQELERRQRSRFGDDRGGGSPTTSATEEYDRTGNVSPSQDDATGGEQKQSSSKVRSMRRLPDHRDTRRLANALSTSNRVIEQQRQRVEDLKQRLAAAGIDVTAIEERVRGGPGRRKQASTPTPSGGNGGASDYQCPARLYPGHCKIPPPRSSSASPPPAASESRELPPPREMDPKVLARLYRPLHEFRPPEPVSHDITQRTAVIRHNGEPYRGDSVSKDKIPKVKLTEDTVKRCYDNEIVRRRAHLKQSADKVEADKRAEHLRVRSTIGMPKLALPATGGAPQPGFDRNGLPEFTKEKAERLHDQMCARFKAAHAAAAEKALAREREHRVHPDRKLTKEEMQMSALRLHDESVRRLKDTMLAAATKANAVNLKTATLYQSQGGSSAD